MLSGGRERESVRHQPTEIEHPRKGEDMPEAGPAHAGGSYERKRHPNYLPGCDFHTPMSFIAGPARVCQSATGAGPACRLPG